MRPWYIQSAAAQSDHCHEVLNVLEAVGSRGHDTNLSVESFGTRVGMPCMDIGTDALEVIRDRVRRFQEWRGAFLVDPPQPVHEQVVDVVRGGGVEDGDQALLHQVGLVEGMVLRLELPELASSNGVELPRGTLESEPGLLERLLHLGGCLIDQRPTDLVERNMHQALDMEAVEGDVDVGGALGEGLLVGTGHVDGGELELGDAIGPQGAEKGVQRGGVPTGGDPDHAATIVVGDDGDVLVMLLVAQLIDADVAQAMEPRQGVAAETTGDALDDPPHGVPGDAQEARDERPVGPLGHQGDELLEGLGEARVGLGPWDLLDPDAASRALGPPQRVAELAPHTAEIEVAPQSSALVIPGACAPASRTPADLPGWCDIDDDSLVSKLRTEDASMIEAEESAKESGGAHGRDRVTKGRADCHQF